MKIKYVFAVLVSLVMPLMVQAVQFPHLNDQIVDEANVLSSLQKTQIMQNLSGLTSQVVVASVRSMNGMEIEEMEMQMIDRSEDCGCSDTVSDCANNKCPNFKFDAYTPSIPDPSNTWFWFQNASEHNERACTVNLRENNVYCDSSSHSQRAHAGRRAACK